MANAIPIPSKAQFRLAMKKGMIRELYRRQKITKRQFEQLMQLQRSR